MAQNLHRRVESRSSTHFFYLHFRKHILDYAKNRVMLRRFIKALAAVLAGAAIYWILRPHLPVAAQHQIFHEDLGLLIYGLISAAIYGLLYWLDRR